ncbi:MAG TPA: glycosyltransferase [Acidimicrobiales bacterium]
MTTRTYLFTLVDGGGTVPPDLALVRTMVERGHTVAVIAEDTMAAEVEATGATFRPWIRGTNRPTRLPADDPYQDWECTSPMALFERMLDRQLVGPASGYATDTAAAIAQVRPDAVVCSFFALGAMVAAEASGLPYVVTHANLYLLPVPGRTPAAMGLRPARGPIGRVRDRAVLSFTGRMWKRGKAGLDEVRAEHGLAPLDRFWDQAQHAELELVLAAEAFDFPGPLPDTVRYVGPVLEDPPWTDAWTAPAGDAPLILVGLSSTFQDQADCLQRIIDGLATLDVRAVVTTGPTIEPDALRAPAGFSVVQSAPHSEVLAQAAAVVTHGGHGTVMKSLAAGVPMLVLPHGRDQGDNAVRVTSRGAGLQLKRSASATAIAGAVRRLLDDPTYSEQARSLGEAIRREADVNRAADALEVVVVPVACAGP